MSAIRRLHEARRAATRNEPTFLSAVVVEVDEVSGTATVTYDGVTIEQVRYQTGFTPQVGNQVSMMMNGTEPFIVSGSGSTHDPVFSGAVVANSFHARRGTNLLAGGESVWDGWSASDDGIAEMSGQSWVLTLPTSASPLVLTGPLVSIPFVGRYYTGFFEVAEDVERNMESAWLTILAFDVAGEEVASWGTTVPAGRKPEGPRYPTPEAAQVPPVEAAYLQLQITIPTSVAGEVVLSDTALFTAPVMEGGSLIMGAARVDPSGADFPEVSVDGIPLGRSPYFRTFDCPSRSLTADTLMTLDSVGTPVTNRGGFVEAAGTNSFTLGLRGIWDISATVVFTAGSDTSCFAELQNVDTGTRYYGGQCRMTSSYGGIISFTASVKVVSTAHWWVVRARLVSGGDAFVHSLRAKYEGEAV